MPSYDAARARHDVEAQARVINARCCEMLSAHRCHGMLLQEAQSSSSVSTVLCFEAKEQAERFTLGIQEAEV
jgi:hypothetical protein